MKALSSNYSIGKGGFVKPLDCPLQFTRTSLILQREFLMLHAFDRSALGEYCVHFCDTVLFTEVLCRSKISYLF